MLLQGFTNLNRLNKWNEIFNIPYSNNRLDNKAPFEMKPITSIDIQNYQKTKQIYQDVLRTRSNELYYSTSIIKSLQCQTLLKYCIHYHIDYMQGMNELLAPMLAIHISYNNDDNIINDTTIIDQTNDVNDIKYLDETGNLYELKHDYDIQLVLFDKFISLLVPTMFSTKGITIIL